MNTYRTDAEIARSANKLPITEIAAKLGIPEQSIIPYGHDKAKVEQDFIRSLYDRPDGKLILVTAMLNLGIDSLSRLIRSRLRLSTRVQACDG